MPLVFYTMHRRWTTKRSVEGQGGAHRTAREDAVLEAVVVEQVDGTTVSHT